MTDFEEQMQRRWKAWLKTPGAAERVVAAVRADDKEEFARLFRAATAVDHPSWSKVIAEANSRVS